MHPLAPVAQFWREKGHLTPQPPPPPMEHGGQACGAKGHLTPPPPPPPMEHGGQACGASASALDVDAAAEIVLAEVAARPDVFVNPYLVEVQDRAPSGRDRLKERIRAAGPTVGHSVAGGVG